MNILKEADTSLDPIQGKTVAVLGYGNQGRAQALNLRDSGIDVVVGNREDEYRDLAKREGWSPVPIPQAAAAGDIVLVLTTDECQPLIWEEQIVPGIESGNTLCWGSGYNVGYEVIDPPQGTNVVMIAPIMPGNVVRRRFEAGSGVIGQFAVHQDAIGDARDITLALCRGMGLTRAGIYETSMLGEAHLNLFTEQVVWAGLDAWITLCYEVAVEAGHDPEEVIMVLYASTENAEIFRLCAEYGFFKQATYHSTTSQYGSLTRSKTIFNDEVRVRARQNLVHDIMGGAFVKEWTHGHEKATERLKELTRKALEHPMSRNEDRVIEMLAASQRSRF